jgi:hypothetical protein
MPATLKKDKRVEGSPASYVAEQPEKPHNKARATRKSAPKPRISNRVLYAGIAGASAVLAGVGFFLFRRYRR